MQHQINIINLCILSLTSTFSYGLLSDIKGFDDTLLFSIDWPGQLPKDYTENTNDENIVVVSAHEEKYSCFIPNINAKPLESEETYTGPSPLELISPLFSQASCSFRLESYWTYEVCHGRYIRQFHEDRESKKVKLQEYILGQWSEIYLALQLEEAKVDYNSDPVDLNEKDVTVRTKKIDNVNLPYLEVIMENGTLCELNQNKPRITKVLYVCYIHGKHEIYQLKEISTCMYEIIILTPLLCSHPKYKPKETGEHNIQCVPLGNAPVKPYSLYKLREESAKLRKNTDLDRIRVELIQTDRENIKMLQRQQSLENKIVDTSPVESFLLGKNCLNGGTGWWKFEFCYGKYVDQYHINEDGTKISIKLGYFDKQKHLDWIKDRPQRRPKPLAQRKQLSHLYSGGSVCDKTGKPRQTEVKLKCLENASSPNSVALYLLEPRYCEYILGVESPLICDILGRVDENGLVSDEEFANIVSDNEEEITTVKIKF